MLDQYILALKKIIFACGFNPVVQSETGRTESVSIDPSGSVNIYDVFNFDDRMDIEPHMFDGGGPNDKILQVLGCTPDSLSNTSNYSFIGYNNLQRFEQSVIKAMLVALLNSNGKRTSSLSSDDLETKKNIFYNCLSRQQFKDTSIKPWNNWRDTHTTVNISSISKTNGIVTVTTSSNHGLSSSYDDWGCTLSINNSNFDILETSYPNGVPITITSPNTFTYRKSGTNVANMSVSGTINIKIGWGGAKNNLHLYFS